MGDVRRYWPLVVAALLAAGLVAASWPGLAEYDSVAQFGQALSGQYDDWHPPVMARLWAALHAIVGGEAGPMLVLQMALYWFGLGMIAAALARIDRPSAAAAVIALGALPVFAFWQMAVLKDAQMLGGVLAAVGIVASYRLRDRRVPWWAWAMAGVLIGYATLVRANAVFATVPLVVMLTVARWPWRVGLVVAGTVAVLVASGPINHRLLDAADSGVRTTEPRYDLAGMAVRVDDPAATRLDSGDVAALRDGRCVKAFFWDPLGGGACADAISALTDMPAGQLYATLARAAARHPLAYAAHRLAHLDSTDRWLVPAGLPSAWPQPESEPNAIGLGNPGPAAAWAMTTTRPLAETPLAWPIAWLVVGLAAACVGLARPPSPLRDTAIALLASGLALEASFAVVSIASDLRYHLWPMMATGLAMILLLAEARPGRRAVALGGAALALAVAGGVAARLTMPRAPATYQAMLSS